MNLRRPHSTAFSSRAFEWLDCCGSVVTVSSTRRPLFSRGMVSISPLSHLCFSHYFCAFPFLLLSWAGRSNRNRGRRGPRVGVKKYITSTTLASLRSDIPVGGGSYRNASGMVHDSASSNIVSGKRDRKTTSFFIASNDGEQHFRKQRPGSLRVLFLIRLTVCVHLLHSYLVFSSCIVYRVQR